MRNTYEGELEGIMENNPWKTVWSSPKKTVRSAITFKKTRLLYILVIIAGVLRVLDGAVADNMGDSLPFVTILLISLFGGAVVGVVGWWILAGLMTFIGKWVGGIGSYEEMKVAIAISYIPLAISSLLYLLDILFIGKELFMDSELSLFKSFWLLFSSTISVVFSIWSLFILIKGIAEVHRFSSWKGLLTFVLPSIILFILVFALIAVI